jgi:hypothetical protein
MHTKLNHEVDGVGMAVASRRAVVLGRRASSGRARGDVGEHGQQWRAGTRRRARGTSADGAAKGLTDGGRDRGGIRMRPATASLASEEAAAVAGSGAAAASPVAGDGARRPAAVVHGRPEEEVPTSSGKAAAWTRGISGVRY